MSTEPKGRRPRVGGGGDIAGIAVALLLASRFLGPLMRGIGPGGRHLMLLALAVALPLGIGVRAWRRRQEEREIGAVRARRMQRKQRKPTGPNR